MNETKTNETKIRYQASTLKDKLSDAMSLVGSGVMVMGEITMGELRDIPDRYAKVLHGDLLKLKQASQGILKVIEQIEKGEFE